MKFFVQWSLDESNADGVRNVAKPHGGKLLHEIRSAPHDSMGPPEALARAIGIDSEWLGDHGLGG